MENINNISVLIFYTYYRLHKDRKQHIYLCIPAYMKNMSMIIYSCLCEKHKHVHFLTNYCLREEQVGKLQLAIIVPF